MRALYDHTGEVRIWLRDDEKWLLDLQGNAIAIVQDGNIYDLSGYVTFNIDKCQVPRGTSSPFSRSRRLCSSVRPSVFAL